MNYSDLAPIVAIDAIGAPTPLIVRKIAEAAHSFYRRTRAYQHLFTLDPVPANTKDVAITVPAGTVFIETIDVELGPNALTAPYNNQFNDGWRDATGRPTTFKSSVGSLRLVPYPIVEIDEALVVKVAVAPLLTASSVADEPGLRHQEALIAGAKALVLATPRKEWTDLVAARDESIKFERLINEHRVLVRNEGLQTAQFRVKPRFV